MADAFHKQKNKILHFCFIRVGFSCILHLLKINYHSLRSKQLRIITYKESKSWGFQNHLPFDIDLETSSNFYSQVCGNKGITNACRSVNIMQLIFWTHTYRSSLECDLRQLDPMCLVFSAVFIYWGR